MSELWKRDGASACCELEMNREYYTYWYRLNEKDGYLIWFSTDEDDGFVIDEERLIPSFENMADLQSFASKLNIKVDTENPNLFDLDIVKKWLSKTTKKIENYNPILDAWNLFDDISISTNGNFDLEKDLTNNIYNKIFWGCNLHAMTPEGKKFTPTWTRKELKIISEVLNEGFQLFNDKITNH